MTVRQIAKGIGIRALILIAGIIILGVWLISLAFKIAGAFIHLMLWAAVILIVVGAIAIFARRFRRRSR